MLSTILSSPLIVALLGGVVASVMAYISGRLSGTKKELQRQYQEKLKAAEDRLEMDREASVEERKATGMSDDEARQEALKWAKR